MTKIKTGKDKQSGLPLWVWAALALGLVVGGFYLFGRGQTADDTAPLADEVSAQQAAELRDQGAFVLDVREPDEWAAGHIPGATLIPLGELPARLSEVPRDQTVLVYCRTGRRSATGRDILKAAGFANVTSLAGGINEWKAAGYETVSGE